MTTQDDWNELDFVDLHLSFCFLFSTYGFFGRNKLFSQILGPTFDCLQIGQISRT
jgi:hypothetical protein